MALLGRGRSIEQALLDSRVGIDPPVAQEGPVGSMFVHASPFDLRHDDLFAIDAALRHDLAAGRDNETLSPELDPGSSGGRFVTHPVHRRDVAAIRDRMTALHRFPRGILRRAVFFLLGRMPSDRRWIKQNLGAAQSCEPRGFRIPLVPANADADFPLRGGPRLKTKIARRNRISRDKAGHPGCASCDTCRGIPRQHR